MAGLAFEHRGQKWEFFRAPKLVNSSEGQMKKALTHTIHQMDTEVLVQLVPK